MNWPGDPLVVAKLLSDPRRRGLAGVTTTSQLYMYGPAQLAADAGGVPLYTSPLVPLGTVYARDPANPRTGLGFRSLSADEVLS